MTEKIISKKEVEKVAELARINLSEEEKTKFAGNLNDILEYFKDLGDVQVDGGEKFDHYELRRNHLREDEVKEVSDDEKEKIKELFPERKDDQLKVKTVLNGSH